MEILDVLCGTGNGIVIQSKMLYNIKLTHSDNNKINTFGIKADPSGGVYFMETVSSLKEN